MNANILSAMTKCNPFFLFYQLGSIVCSSTKQSGDGNIVFLSSDLIVLKYISNGPTFDEKCERMWRGNKEDHRGKGHEQF